MTVTLRYFPEGALYCSPSFPGPIFGWEHIIPYFDPLYTYIRRSIWLPADFGWEDVTRKKVSGLHNIIIKEYDGSISAYSGEESELVFGSKPNTKVARMPFIPGLQNLARINALGPSEAHRDRAWENQERATTHYRVNGEAFISPANCAVEFSLGSGYVDSSSPIKVTDFIATIRREDEQPVVSDALHSVPSFRTLEVKAYSMMGTHSHYGAKPLHVLPLKQLLSQLDRSGGFQDGVIPSGPDILGDQGAGWRVHSVDVINDSINEFKFSYFVDTWSRDVQVKPYQRADFERCKVTFTGTIEDYSPLFSSEVSFPGVNVTWSLTVENTHKQRWEWTLFEPEWVMLSLGLDSDIVATKTRITEPYHLISRSMSLRFSQLIDIDPQSNWNSFRAVQFTLDTGAASVTDTPHMLWDNYVAAVDQVVNSLDSNVLETVGDLINISNLVPPVSDLKKLWNWAGMLGYIANIIRVAAGLHLYHRFVYNTTLLEVREYHRYITERLQSSLDVLSSHEPFYHRSGSSAPSSVISGCDVKVSVKVCGILTHQYILKTLERFNDVSRTLLRTSNVWDLVKFSFLVDYFTPVGDIFETFDENFKNLNVGISYYVHSHKYSRPVDILEFADEEHRAIVISDCTEEVYRRDVGYMPPTAVSEPLNLNVNKVKKNLLTIGAVLVSLSR